MAAWIGIEGEFPISDDWAYARAVQSLLEAGRIERVAWTWVPLLAHTALGVSFSAVFGFSYETLRLSSLVMGWLGLLGAYVLCRVLEARPAWSALGAATVGLNPLHLVLSYSFMTDVPFTALITWSLVFLARGLARPSSGSVAGGLLLAALAVSSRQLAFPLFGAAILAVLLRRPRDVRLWLPIGVAGLAVLALLLAWPSLGLGAGDAGSFAGADRYQRMLRSPHLLFFAARNGLWFVTYAGLFVASAAFAARAPRPGGAPLAAASAALAALALGLAAGAGLHMPFTVDVVNDFFLGWITVQGADTLPRAPAALWWALAAAGLTLGFFAAGRLALEAVDGRSALRQDGARLLLLLFPVLYLLVLLPRWPCFDRYLLPVLPPLAALLLAPAGGARRSPRFALPLGVILLGVLSAYAVAGTRDNLEHHRARWELLDELLADGVPPRCIDGGFEFGGRYNYDPRPEATARRWVVDDAYVVSLAERLPGRRRVAERTYRRLLPPGRERLTVFRREGDACGGPASQTTP